jgi:hypothetical protein
LNEKAHLLIAISINAIFLFADNLFMPLVPSSHRFSTTRISQSHTSHARFELPLCFDYELQPLIQLIYLSLSSSFFGRDLSFSDMT